MDQPHPEGAAAGAAPVPGGLALPAPGPGPDAAPPSQPQDDDERFIVGLVLTYYRRHPQRARTRLLDLLGEVLTPPAEAATSPTKAAPGTKAATAARSAPPAPPAPPAVDDRTLWAQAQARVAPLKPKR